MMGNITRRFACEANAAKQLDMTVAEFRALVEAGHLPKGKSIGGLIRWDMEELFRIVSGEAVEGIGGVQW